MATSGISDSFSFTQNRQEQHHRLPFAPLRSSDFTKISWILLLVLLFGASAPLLSAVRGTGGVIEFDADRNGSSEMTVNTNGLTVYHSFNHQGLQTISSNTTLSANSIIFADTSANPLTITLPTASGVSGRTYSIKKTCLENSLTLAASNCFIDKSRTVDVRALTTSWYPTVDLISDGQNWHILNIGAGGSTVASDNLLAWFPLNSSSGNVISDVSSNGYKATLHGNATITSSHTAVGNGAMSLDGDGDYLVTSGFSESYDYFSVTLFAYHTSLTSKNDMIARQDGTGTGRTLLYDGDGVTIMIYVNGAGYDTSYTPTANQWIHYALVYNNGTFTIYANGSEIYSLVQTEENASGEFVFGRHKSNASNFFSGLLDDIRIYDKALSTAEVEALSAMRVF
jgi:hypothetical protein